MILYSQIAESQRDLPFYNNKYTSSGLLTIGLKGKVKSVKQTSYKAEDSSGVIRMGIKKNASLGVTVNSNFNILFDDKGRIIKEKYYKTSGELEITSNHSYNNTYMEETDESDLNGKIQIHRSYKYNSKGEKIESSSFLIYDDGGNFNNKMIFTYNDKGNLIGWDVYTTKNKINLQRKSIYKYDDKGNQIENNMYTSKGIPAGKETYKYDEIGNITEQIYYNNDCKTIEKKLVFKYDKEGNVILKEQYQPTDKISKKWVYKYKYDKNNNWIERVDFENENAMFILERELEYFDIDK